MLESRTNKKSSNVPQGPNRTGVCADMCKQYALTDNLNELDGKDDEWNTCEMQLPLKTERRLIMQPLGEPAIRRKDKFVRKANAIRETGTDLLDQTLKRFDRINSISDEACRAESFPGTKGFRLIQ
jgi:hypothetical protein